MKLLHKKLRDLKKRKKNFLKNKKELKKKKTN
jgi:hypothetical protein